MNIEYLKYVKKKKIEHRNTTLILIKKNDVKTFSELDLNFMLYEQYCFTYFDIFRLQNPIHSHACTCTSSIHRSSDSANKRSFPNPSNLH